MRTAVALRVMYGQGVRTLQAASLLTKRSLLDRRKARIGEVAKSRRRLRPNCCIGANRRVPSAANFGL